MDTEVIEKRIQEIEHAMQGADFWNDKVVAQAAIKELKELKEAKEGAGKYDKGSVLLTILSGAGGDDAEDFSALLVRMYEKYAQRNHYTVSIVHQHVNDHGGYRNITLRIEGKGVYGNLKHESGVHRLVRVSPFNADKKRHTSFSLVEVVPLIPPAKALSIPPGDLRFELSRSSGPGGQNVNKRETAVRVVHIPTGLAAHSDNERSQEKNKEQALSLLYGKLVRKAEEERKTLEESMQISKTTEIEWGNQIRSYVLHPYKMVKDHRTNVETSDVDSVLQDGAIELFIEASAHSVLSL